MAQKASANKMMVGVKVPDKNYKYLEEIVRTDGGSIAGYINDAIVEWLKAKGLEPELSIDGRLKNKKEKA
jgi:predicted metal-dependent phosphotriesterase family hydrolase